jgi:hypothetical protein
MGIRTLHRRTAMATTVAVATATVTAAVVPVLFPPVPAVSARASTARLPAADRSPYRPARSRSPRGPGLAARTSRERAAEAARTRVRSVGAFTGPARTHRLIVASYDNPKTATVTVSWGRAIEHVARVVHRGLGRRRGPRRGGVPGIRVSGPWDGSAPYGTPSGRGEPERDATP